MRLVNKKYIAVTISLLLFLFLISECSLKEKSIAKTANYFRKKNGVTKTKKDTVVLVGNEKFFYKSGFLIKVGKVKGNYPVGKWFIFSDSLKLKYVLQYNNGKVDTLYRPFLLINDSW